MSLRNFVKYWLPVLGWMALIFTASTDLGSTRHTSRIIEPFLRFFSPDVTEKTIHDVQVAVRKAGHMTGYAFLAALIWRARRGGRLEGWERDSARFAVVVATLYATTDEFHQSFVPTREGSIWDVMIDSLGAALGIGLIFAVGKLRRKW